MGEKPLFIKKKKSKLFWVLLILLIIVASGAGAYYFLELGVRTTGIKLGPLVTTTPGEIVFRDPQTGQLKDNLTILVLGLDESRDERGILHHKGSRTDTIFLLELDRQAQRLGVLSIPRDTWVFISEKYGNNRVNTAYPDAFWDVYLNSGHDYEKAKAAGIAQARETIQNLIGVEIDHYVLLKIKGAEELVDALGGLIIDVEKDMDYDDNWGNLHIHLKKGRRRLNGAQVVGYARFRHDEEGDWGRIRRQQQVIQALVNELKKPTHIMNIKKIAKVVKDNVETDMDTNDLIDLARVYKDFDRDNLIRGVIRGEDDVINGNMVVVPNQTVKERMVKRILLDPKDIPNDQLWLRVLNGCGVDGLGAETAKVLRDEDYVVVEVANAEEQDVITTRIIDHFNNPKAAKKIKELLNLPGARMIQKRNENGDLTLDFTIILGEDCAFKRQSSEEEAPE